MSSDIRKMEEALNAIMRGIGAEYIVEWDGYEGYIVQYDNPFTRSKVMSRTKCRGLWRMLENLSAISHDMDTSG